MKVARKLLTAGGASLVLAGGIVTFPAALPANATFGHGGNHHDSSYVLKEESNAAYSVKTQVNPEKHKLWSVVTNNTNAPITPVVTFNGDRVAMHGNDGTLDPGESQKYYYYFTGNNFNVDIAIAAQGVETFTSSALVNLPETVSFKTDKIDTENKIATGTLTNNTADPQTVYVKTHKKNKITENLAPNESRTVTLSWASHRDKDRDSNDRCHHDDKYVRVSVATQAGFDSSYKVFVGYKTLDPAPQS